MKAFVLGGKLQEDISNFSFLTSCWSVCTVLYRQKGVSPAKRFSTVVNSHLLKQRGVTLWNGSQETNTLQKSIVVAELICILLVRTSRPVRCVQTFRHKIPLLRNQNYLTITVKKKKMCHISQFELVISAFGLLILNLFLDFGKETKTDAGKSRIHKFITWDREVSVLSVMKCCMVLLFTSLKTLPG